MADVAEANAYMSKIACRYYRFGICSKGDQCQYLHEFEPKDYNRCSESQHDFNQPSLTDDASVLPSERSDETVPSAGDWTSNANNWVKAWEFVPGQMWRSLACDDGSAAYCGDEQSCDYSWQPSGYNQSCDYGQCFGFSEPQCGSYDAAVGGMVDGIIASCDSTAGCGQFAAAGPPVAVDICDMSAMSCPQRWMNNSARNILRSASDFMRKRWNCHLPFNAALRRFAESVWKLCGTRSRRRRLALAFCPAAVIRSACHASGDGVLHSSLIRKLSRVAQNAV
jgi:hypothetical protein